MGGGVDEDAAVKPEVGLKVEGERFGLGEREAWWALKGESGHVYWQGG